MAAFGISGSPSNAGDVSADTRGPYAQRSLRHAAELDQERSEMAKKTRYRVGVRRLAWIDPMDSKAVQTNAFSASAAL